MLIDWFTVGAQALNFVILVWLMKRFLYQPILRAIDDREKRVAEVLADATTQRAEAERERTSFQLKNEEFDELRAARMSELTDEAEAERERLMQQTEKAATVLRAKRHEALKSEARELDRAIGHRAREEVFAIARRALSDLATANLEERIGDVFIRRLQALDDPAKTRLGLALKTTSAPAILRSAFTMPHEQRAAIQSALNEAFAVDVDVRFETASDLIGGIELSAHGQKMAWSIDDYLGSLQKSVAALVERRVQPGEETKLQSVPVRTGAAHEHSA